MNKNIYFPIKIIRNKSRNGVICIKALKADTFEIIELYTNNLGLVQGKTGFVFGNFKYNTDNIAISDSSKVIVYNDIENDLYGVVTYSTHPQLWWIPKENIRSNKSHLDTLLNLNIVETADTYYNVDSAFNKSWKSDEKSVYRIEELKFKIDGGLTKDKFMEMLCKLRNKPIVLSEEPEELENTVESEHIIESESISEKVEDNTEKSEETEKQPIVNIEALVKDLVERELKISKLDEELKQKEEALIEREKELIERDANFLKNQAFTPNVKQLEITDVDDRLSVTTETFNIEKGTYELLLRVLKRGNVISLPFNVYKQFKIIPKGAALDRNSDYTVFTQVAVIKYDNIDNRSILAMIEVDNENPVNVTILMEYGTNTYEADDILSVIENYRRMKRNRSYLV